MPVWALGRLEAWSGMRACWAVATHPLAGPLSRRLTDLAPRIFRSALVGQANAMLVDPKLNPVDGGSFVVNPPALRGRVAGELGLPRATARYWGRNRRVCHTIVVPEGVVVANVHATTHPDRRLARAELDLVAELLGGRRCVLCGDLNIEEPGLAGFSGGGPGIDHVLVRGVALAGPQEPWSQERRRHDHLVLSDHAPVDARVAWT